MSADTHGLLQAPHTHCILLSGLMNTRPAKLLNDSSNACQEGLNIQASSREAPQLA
jgi:hypothetical protein